MNAIHPLRRHHLVPVFGNALWLVALLWSSLKSLQLISVPLYVVSAYSRPLFTGVIEYFWLGRTLSPPKIAALFFVLLGSVLYAFSDNTVTIYGLGFAVLNTLLVAGLSVYENLIMNTMKAEQTPFGVNLFRVLFTLPFLLVLSFTHESPDWDAVGLFNGILLVISSTVGLFLGVVMFALQRLVSATSIQLGNVLFKFLTTLASLTIHPVQISLQGWIGYAVCSAGFLLYSTIAETQNPQPPPKSNNRKHTELE